MAPELVLADICSDPTSGLRQLKPGSSPEAICLCRKKLSKAVLRHKAFKCQDDRLRQDVKRMEGILALDSDMED